MEALTDSTDSRQYIEKMRQRDKELNSYWGTICTPLEILAPDGKVRKTNCANTERLSSDIKKEFSDIEGFSTRNLWRMKAFYNAYREEVPQSAAESFEFLPQVVAEIPSYFCPTFTKTAAIDCRNY